MWHTSVGDVSTGHRGDVRRWCAAPLPHRSVRPLGLGVNFRGPTAESGNQQVLYGLLDVAGIPNAVCDVATMTLHLQVPSY